VNKNYLSGYIITFEGRKSSSVVATKTNFWNENVVPVEATILNVENLNEISTQL
jgi:hypothetical protein